MEIKNQILNIILISFPILIYFIYNCYREITKDKYNRILFNLSLFISQYLCLKYGNYNSYTQVLLYLNIPILIAYIKKESLVSIILSIIVIINTKIIIKADITILILQYLSFYLIYIISKKKKTNTLIKIISVLQGFYISLISFLYYNANIITVLEITLSTIIFYTITYIFLYIFNLGDNISSLYLNTKEFEKEKQLKNSLFQITHEVKNPITVCKGYLEMIDINNKEKTIKYLTIIKQEIDRSINIMNDFMEFSKIKIEKEIMDINVLLEDITEELNIILKSKKIKLTTKIPKDEVFIDGDYNRLKQVFVNLIKNSIESINKKGNIDITTHTLKDKYYIEITDDGCGMDEETRTKIKEMFFTTKKNGTGLGVSLSNEIIKAHNGAIEYKSKPRKGTKVIVKLPLNMI